ncbi:hypothetical protein PHMEG_00025493 [Phytophthora megakarya]|uniref:RxLR effector protein n=1 Tax=Phytophthora megakarya TaxID=4795 RepID=A0A225VBH8_9STRA|nr:hypothetical protein PHMEG_00025493 [Phytophthora megakarya]
MDIRYVLLVVAAILLACVASTTEFAKTSDIKVGKPSPNPVADDTTRLLNRTNADEESEAVKEERFKFNPEIETLQKMLKDDTFAASIFAAWHKKKLWPATLWTKLKSIHDSEYERIYNGYWAYRVSRGYYHWTGNKVDDIWALHNRVALRNQQVKPS